MKAKTKIKETALVTGASFGIGLEMARVLAREGHDLVLVARSVEKLNEVARELEKEGVKIHILVRDLSLPGSAKSLYEEVVSQGYPVSWLINNAGHGLHGRFDEMDPARITGMLRLNIESLTELTRFFIPGMRSAGYGRILNVASTAAFQPGPLMAAYYASKAYVLMFSEAVAEELRGSGVKVSTLCPGPTHSEFQERAGMGHVELFKRFSMDPLKVAKAGVHGMKKGKRVIIPGLLNKILAFSTRLSPRWLIPKIVYALQAGRAEK